MEWNHDAQIECRHLPTLNLGVINKQCLLLLNHHHRPWRPPCHCHQWLQPHTFVTHNHNSEDDMAMPCLQVNEQPHRSGWRVPRHCGEHGYQMTKEDDVIVCRHETLTQSHHHCNPPLIHWLTCRYVVWIENLWIFQVAMYYYLPTVVEWEKSLPNGADEAPHSGSLVSPSTIHFWATFQYQKLIYAIVGTKCSDQSFKITFPLH